MTAEVAGEAEPRPTGAPRRAKPEKNRPSAFWPVAGTAIPLMSLLSRLTLIDAGKVPATGAFVLTPNHITEIDPVVVGWALWRIGRAPRFLAKASLFDVPVLGRILSSTGQVPVQRAGAGAGGAAVPLDGAKRLVEDGHGLIVYPEGSLTRDPDSWPMRGKSGAVRIALQNDIPIIPAAHWGAQRLMGRYGRNIHLFPRAKIRMKFGDPVDLSEFRGRPLDGPTLSAATDRVMAAITVLLEDLRGETAPAERWDPKKKGQSEIGRFD
jgi:1-acyl-sn-glycerol-3-phosphate acyltransferase